LIIIGYLLFKSLELLFSFLQSVNPTVGASIIAGVTTVMVGIATQYLPKKRQLDDVHREKKIQIYEEFMKMADACRNVARRSAARLMTLAMVKIEMRGMACS